LRDRITAALDDSGDDDDRTRLSTLRLMACAMRDREAALKGRDEGPAAISDAEVAEILATMLRQREVIEHLAEAGLRDRVRVMVGGSPVTQGWADDIGADGFAEDAAAAVPVAKRLVGA
jgi:uncharacterized protein YqeY